jgi:hypothetical protein
LGAERHISLLKEPEMPKRTFTIVIAIAAGIFPAQLSHSRLVDRNVTMPEEMDRLVSRVKSAEVSGWEKIPWVRSLVDARTLSAKENAPVFLFVLDGNMATGRC